MSVKTAPLLCHRAISVQKAPLLQSRVLRGRTVHVELWVTGLSAPRAAGAGIAAAWASRSLPEAAASDSTADGEPRRQYANDSLLYFPSDGRNTHWQRTAAHSGLVAVLPLCLDPYRWAVWRIVSCRKLLSSSLLLSAALSPGHLQQQHWPRHSRRVCQLSTRVRPKGRITAAL